MLQQNVNLVDMDLAHFFGNPVCFGWSRIGFGCCGNLPRLLHIMGDRRRKVKRVPILGAA